MSASETGWRDLVEQAAEHEPSDGPELWFLVDLASSGTRPRVDWTAPEAVTSVVLARPTSGGARERVEPLSSAPKGRDPGGAAGLVCQLARAGNSPVVSLTRPSCQKLLPELCRARKLYGLGDDDLERPIPLHAADATPWQLNLEAEPASGPDGGALLSGRLGRTTSAGPESVALSRVAAVLDTGFVVIGNELGELADGALTWLKRLRVKPLFVKASELDEFLGTLGAAPSAPRVVNVEELGYDHVAPRPVPVLRVTIPDGTQRVVDGRLLFRYQPAGSDAYVEVGGERIGKTLALGKRRFVRRDHVAEARHLATLRDAGAQVDVITSETKVCPFEVRLRMDVFARTCEELLDAGFEMEAQGAPLRRPGRWRLICSADQDWFDVKGVVKFDATDLELPRLLATVRKSERFVRLGDGSTGVLPERWLAELSPLAALVNPRSKRLRFHAAQALMIDGLLPDTWSRELEGRFEEMKARLAAFEGAKERREPESFQGSLRGYQRTALGFIEALSSLGLGGCLADDMGLGKTIVVLAWLLLRKERGAGAPSLIVVPKSLLFNWRAETERFAPSLRVLLHHDKGRGSPGPHFSGYDVVLTSYGTLRRDAFDLAKIEFDYVILDEAHTIKNEDTETHRAARSLQSRFRLALTGTPLENHVLELWSLMTFLNPGVFEPLSHLRRTFERKRPSEIALTDAITRSIRPFLLRRTKAEAAPELPARVEKTVYVELGHAQRRLYDALKAHYQARLLERRERRRNLGPAHFGTASGTQGPEAAEALEALLRLRQVACHSGLVDQDDQALLGAHEPHEELPVHEPNRSPFSLDEPPPPKRRPRTPPTPSAKLDILVPELRSLQAEGHKSLVFSQFRGLLGLLARELDAARIHYEVLDGQTRRRKDVVRRFQEHSGACTFLISLKTGGVGLNLTEADYVFLLDPWWNPAAESQAIDRAHRIGQTRPVIAYRLLAQDTVEAKVAALQERKRAMTEALFSGAAGFSKAFSREDLEFLLG